MICVKRKGHGRQKQSKAYFKASTIPFVQKRKMFDQTVQRRKRKC